MSLALSAELEDTLKAQRRELRTELKDCYNRLHSIAHDATFVAAISERYDFPLVPNQRCGAWYVRPAADLIHAYFKSTDGHIGDHNFNLRRANLSLLPVVLDAGGIVLVDSTRRGKRFPDALSKTIPIWCAVLNRVRFLQGSVADDTEWRENSKLWTLPTCVGRSEHEQIERQIDGWAQDLLKSSYSLEVLRKLTKPLRPIFISPSSILSPSLTTASTHPDFYPVVCLSASRLSGEAERAEGWSYVQGAGDDHEAWAKGLTAKLFWDNEQCILTTSRAELEELLEQLVAANSVAPELSDLSLGDMPLAAVRIRATRLLLDFVREPSPSDSPTRIVIHISTSKAPLLPIPPPTLSGRSIAWHAKSGKLGHKPFFQHLQIALDFVAGLGEGDVLIEVGRCADGIQSEANDLGLSLCLVLLVRRYDDTGAEAVGSTPVSKEMIRNRLVWILEAFPRINPSRAVLVRVNEFLMSNRTSTM